MYKYDSLDQTLVNERVTQYEGQLTRFLNKELTEEEFRPLRLQNGPPATGAALRMSGGDSIVYIEYTTQAHRVQERITRPASPQCRSVRSSSTCFRPPPSSYVDLQLLVPDSNIVRRILQWRHATLACYHSSVDSFI